MWSEENLSHSVGNEHISFWFLNFVFTKIFNGLMLHMLQLHYCGQRLLFLWEGLAPPPVFHSPLKANHRDYLREKLQ